MILLSVKLNVEPLCLELDRCLGVRLGHKAEASSIKLDLELLALKLFDLSASFASTSVEENVVEVYELSLDEYLGFLSFVSPEHHAVFCFCILQSHQTLNASLQKLQKP